MLLISDKQFNHKHLVFRKKDKNKITSYSKTKLIFYCMFYIFEMSECIVLKLKEYRKSIYASMNNWFEILKYWR